MGIFGWSLPPGCNSVPGDEEYPCAICGEFPEKCICPECPECGATGDPVCYTHHGLKRSEEQKFSLESKEREWESDNIAYQESIKDFQDDDWASEYK